MAATSPGPSRASTLPRCSPANASARPRASSRSSSAPSPARPSTSGSRFQRASARAWSVISAAVVIACTIRDVRSCASGADRLRRPRRARRRGSGGRGRTSASCSPQAAVAAFTFSSPIRAPTVSNAVTGSPSARAPRIRSSCDSSSARLAAILPGTSRNGRPCPARQRPTSSSATTSRLRANSPTGSGVWPWSKNRNTRPRRWSPDRSSRRSGWWRTTCDGA